METTFLGHPTNYWIELESKVEKLNYQHLIQEIADLRGKLSFCERRIKEMNDILIIDN